MTSESTARSAKSTKLVLGVIPVTGVIIELLRLLIDEFPGFECKAMFDTSELNLLDEIAASRGSLKDRLCALF